MRISVTGTQTAQGQRPAISPMYVAWLMGWHLLVLNWGSLLSPTHTSSTFQQQSLPLTFWLALTLSYYSTC